MSGFSAYTSLVRDSSRTEYQTRIHRVLGHIEDHIAEDLPLEQLARVACLSPFHFHRVFRAMMNEGLNAFVQRRRLEHAARELDGRRHTTILEVANRYGYENAAAFSRAFRRQFGVSATEWRRSEGNARRVRLLGEKERTRSKDRKIGTDLGEPVWEKLTHRGTTMPPAAESARPRIERLPRVDAVAMHYVGAYGSSDITKLWMRLMAHADAMGVVHAETECVGILHDDPAITEPERCRYDACVIVARPISDALVSSVVLPGGDYLVFPFVGAPVDVDPAWDAVYRALVDSGYQPANGPNLEWYPPQPILDPAKGVFRCKMCVPVVSL
ncbi:AraC family transcriptional regulator [Pendulispora brunnea]|uniref:AraC family transcriptional regulator n=1 Tax=Pendulispora brunnea TaxID=2905690 RepID=A0ABZ2KEE4_9BACT